MNIIQIIPGSGGSFYCGNCLRDSKYVVALREKGYNVTKLPMYLPLFADEHDLTDIPVFYGAISLYLKLRYPFLRSAPAWVDRFLNSKPMLKLAAGMAGSTRAKGLEEMTISMLKGHEGYQNEELEMLINYLKNHAKPDVIHLSNALLLGLAKKIKEDLNVPVVCSLQDEDVWIDAMRPDYVPKLWQMMAEKARDVDAFIAVSHYFSEVMTKKMDLDPEKVHVVHIGVEPEKYKFSSPVKKPMEIGYMSRLNEENGLGIVVDAFIQLKKEVDFCECKLKLTGGSTGDDKRYIRQQISKLRKAGLLKDVEFLDGYEGQEKRDFLSSLSVLTVPVLKGEAFGLYQLEALASGTPIIQPALGAFPEIVEATGGGKIFSPNDSNALSQVLKEIMTDKKLLQSMAEKGRKGVEEKFDLKTLISKMIRVYKIAAEQKKVKGTK